MTEIKHKILSTFIVTAISYLGLQVLVYFASIFQLGIYFQVALWIYAFLVFWLLFIFDVHLRNRGILALLRLKHNGPRLVWEALKKRVEHVFNWHHFSHLLAFLVLPSIIFWTTVILVSLNPFREQIKQILIVISIVNLGVAYWYFTERFSKKLEIHDLGLKVLNLVKLYTAYLGFATVLGLTWYFGLGEDFLLPGLFALTFLILYQALFQHRLLRLRSEIYALGIAGTSALVGLWLSVNWNIQYLTGGIVILAVYNALWGMLHHYLDRTLTKKLVGEYLLMLIVIFSILFATHNFGARVL
ncbi:MAG: hypothetical protein Q8P83_03235 [bacterium]|nr:hypothetical protein [bacterium]